MTGREPVHRLLAQHQGEKGAEDMATDGSVGSRENRPCGQQGVGRKEALLHCQQIAVPQDDLQGCQPRVGAQREQPIEARISLDLPGINGEPFAGGIGQEAAISGIADQRLVTLRQLAFETGQQRGPALGVLAGLFLIAAQHVAASAEDDLVDGEVGLTLLARDGEPHCDTVVVDYRGADLGGRALAHTGNVVDALRLERGDGGGADHAAIADDAGPADAEPCPQAFDDGSQRGDVGGVAGQRNDTIGRSCPSSTIPRTT